MDDTVPNSVDDTRKMIADSLREKLQQVLSGGNTINRHQIEQSLNRVFADLGTGSTIQNVSVAVEEDSDEVKMIKEVMEEPSSMEVVNVEFKFEQVTPINYISFSCNIDSE
jgi:hypothetical protein